MAAAQLTSTAYLSAGRVNLGLLRESTRSELLECLASAGVGKKALVMDPLLVGPLGLVIESRVLKENGVEKLFHLVPGRMDVPPDVSIVVYLARPQSTLMRQIATAIRANHEKGDVKEYYLFFVPRRTMLCEKVLEEAGVYGDLTIGEFQLELLPLDNDLLSLEMPTAFKECFLHGDRTSMFYVARSLMKLQSACGFIPSLYGKGDNAKHVARMMLRMRRELGGAEEMPIRPEIDQLILLDRNVDFITPMCSQLTYEGLIDEVFGIEHCFVTLPHEVIPPKEGSNKKVIVHLVSGDNIFSEIRDMNFSSVGPLLSQKAKLISQQYDSRHDAKTVTQIREFVGRLGTLQSDHLSLKNHTAITENIMKHTNSAPFLSGLHTEQDFTAGVDTEKINDYIETLLAKREDIHKVIRLICLQSQVNGGLKTKVLDFYKREILQTYGYEYIVALQDLMKIGLIQTKQERNTYPSVRKTLKLIVDDVDESNPSDLSYAYSGYAPLSVRLVQHMCRNGLRGIEELLKMLPGDSFEATQTLPAGVQDKSHSRAPGTQPKITMVFFLGGVTYGEIAALRFLAQQDPSNDFIIATTKIINGDSLINTVVDTDIVPLEKAAPPPSKK